MDATPCLLLKAERMALTLKSLGAGINTFGFIVQKKKLKAKLDRERVAVEKFNNLSEQVREQAKSASMGDPPELLKRRCSEDSRKEIEEETSYTTTLNV